jgi:predicted RNase H-like HicB family nuclease
MTQSWIEKDGTLIDLPNLSAIIDQDGRWFVSNCPELGISSQGASRNEALTMLREAVTLWLEFASAVEIKRRLKKGARVTDLGLMTAPTTKRRKAAHA